MDRDKILNELTALDFMAVDLALYLDTHPMHREAIMLYNQIIETADVVREKYEAQFGPLCSFRSMDRNADMWTWIADPWPWDSSFNFQISGEGCR